MIETEIKTLALSKIPGMGKQSLNQFLDCNDITKQSIDQMTLSISEYARKKKRVKPPLPEEMNSLYQESEAILERQEKCGIFAVSRYSEYYPAKFKELEKPVDLFFVTGNKEILLGDRHIAIIGSLEPCRSRGRRIFKQEDVLALIRKIQDDFDLIYVFPHWGKEGEYTRYPAPWQLKLARSWIDGGADGVFGSHSHVFQGREFYKGKPIYYSLGNFYFPHPETKFRPRRTLR